MKKILKYTGITFLSLLLLLILIPVLFKSRILAFVKEEINKDLDAKVEFRDLSITWFRNFPKLTLVLEDISVAGKGVFEKDTLLAAASFDASVNLTSLFNPENMKVYGIFLNKPRINAIIAEDGRANWEITKPSEASTSTTSTTKFRLDLEKYGINEGHIVYHDRQTGMRAEISGLNHSGKGNFSQDMFTLSTKTKATAASFNYGGIPYLVNTKTGIDADIEISNSNAKYSFSNASLSLNDLKLVANGYLQLVNDSSYSMDISFDAPSNDFRNILSLVPAVYKNEFSKIQTSGEASLKGFVKGNYNASELPAYDISMIVRKGFFKYPDLPKAVNNIEIDANFRNRDGKPDNAEINISRAHLEFGKDPFDLKLVFKNPETVKYLDMVVKGKLELAELANFVKLEKGTKLSGSIQADAFAKGNLSALENHSGPFQAGGFFNIRNFMYQSAALPFPVKKGSFDVQVNNAGGIADATSINVSAGHIEMGEDVFDFNLKIDKPVTAVNFSGKAKGSFGLDKVEKFISFEKGTSLKGKLQADLEFKGSKADIDREAYERISFSGNASLKDFDYRSKELESGFQIKDAALVFSPAHANLQQMNARFMGTALQANGTLDNMVAWFLNKGDLKGRLQLAADRINLNQWMGTAPAGETTATTSNDIFLVPSGIDMVLDARAGEIEYDKVQYRNAAAKMVVRDETIQLQQVYTEALDGVVNFNGSYSTKNDKKQPQISMNYSMKDIDVQKAFYAFNTMQKLMPIGQFLSGKLNSQFSMNGKLGGDMLPLLTSLSGNGDLLLVEGFLAKFQPLEKIAQTLQVNALKDISIKDVRTHIEFANGKVLVKPFNIKVKDIQMQIGGTHGLDQAMDYIIAMKLPRSYLGTAGNNLINNLASEAGRKGIQVNLSETVDLNLRMTGSMNNPSVKTDLKQAAGDVGSELKQQANSFVQQKADSAKKMVADTVNVIKKQLVDDAKNELINRFAGGKDSSAPAKISVDSTKKKLEEKAKGALRGLLKN